MDSEASANKPARPGRIDLHSHLLPQVDDGCRSLEESIACARELVSAGYAQSFCTPHIWPNLPNNNVAEIPRRVSLLQAELDRAEVPLRLHPGGEINLRDDTHQADAHALVTYGMARKFVLIDLWADRLPAFFRPAIAWLQAQGVIVILAHPERMRAVQDAPGLADHFQELGLLLQGNLQCLGDPRGAATREVAEQYLAEGRYTFLGSDLHHFESLPVRLAGLRRAIEAIGEEAVNQLTVENPKMLL